MNHVNLRRLALSFAALSFGALTAAVLVCSASIQAMTPDLQKKGQPKRTFPVQVQGTELIAQRIAAYDGPFYEDGTGRQVLNVAALELHNPGKQTVIAAQIRLITQQSDYLFEVAMIPANSTVLVPEKAAQRLIEGELLQITGWAVCQSEKPGVRVLISADNANTLRVRNLSQQEVTQLKLYHRTYLFDSNLYIGGVAFETVIPYIPSGGEVEITPQNYAEGYSRIVWVQ